MKIPDDPRYRYLYEPHPRFASLGKAILKTVKGEENVVVAHAVSNTWARRICNALNGFGPGKGQL